MKINATTQIEVSLSEQQIAEITTRYLLQVLDWKENYFIEDGKVRLKSVYFSSHSWNSIDTVREASEKDYFAAGIFKILKEQKN